MSEYKRRSRRVRNAARKRLKPRLRTKAATSSRTIRRRGTKALRRKGSATWCVAHGIPVFGEGVNNWRRRHKVAKKA